LLRIRRPKDGSPGGKFWSEPPEMRLMLEPWQHEYWPKFDPMA